ncbi:MAG: hypothetical protein GC185_00980 [Alphaproteobacteria bacterium]|nr:hypothetical protein [Alphaproteobacteria bacterium]
MNSDNGPSKPDPDSSPKLNTHEIIFTMPDNLVEDPGANKSLNFHRFMRHARQCHQNLLEFLMRENLLLETGDCTLVANERKTIIACTDNALRKIAAQPFVEKTEARPDIAPQARPEIRRRPPSHGR